MRRRLATWLLFVTFAAAFSPLVAVADPEETEIWSKDTKEAARHVQSGFVCPKELLTSSENAPRDDLETVVLQTVIVGSGGRPKGEDVGCEYEGKGGSWATVEIVRLRTSETVASHYDAVRERIKTRFPDVLRDAEFPQLPPKVTSPTGGETFAVSYYNVRVGSRRGAMAAIGGEVDGWVITLVHFDYDKSGYGLKLWGAVNWQRIAKSRLARREGN